MLDKQLKRKRRHKRVRSKIYGTAKCPRLSIFRSNKYIYAQLIDDEKGRTLVSAGFKDIMPKTKGKKQKLTPLNNFAKGEIAAKRHLTGLTKTDMARKIGKLLGQKAVKVKIKQVIFDRGGYKYHGRVKAVAEGAREGGLKF